MKLDSTRLFAGVLAAWTMATGAQAQDPASTSTSTTTTAATTTSTTTTTPVRTLGGAGSRAENRIVNSFTTFAGSEDNARSLVTGLRQGTAITLTSPTSSISTGTTSTGGTTTGTSAGTTALNTSTSTTFTPPTRPMGYGNVTISLALAQEQLIRLGITQPTAEQLKASLMGGTVTSGSGATATGTELRGVLQMRADGMGWGQIANAMGTRLGHVMSGLKQTNRQLATGQPVPGAGAGVSVGVTTAAGAQVGTADSREDGRGAQARFARETESGIVTAAGSSAATSASLQAGGGARAGGAVTALGTAGGNRASATGMLKGRGHAGH